MACVDWISCLDVLMIRVLALYKNGGLKRADMDLPRAHLLKCTHAEKRLFTFLLTLLISEAVAKLTFIILIDLEQQGECSSL